MNQPNFVNLINNLLYPCILCQKMWNTKAEKIYVVSVVGDVQITPNGGMRYGGIPAFCCEKCYEENKERLNLVEPSKIVTAPVNIPPDILKSRN